MDLQGQLLIELRKHIDKITSEKNTLQDELNIISKEFSTSSFNLHNAERRIEELIKRLRNSNK